MSFTFNPDFPLNSTKIRDTPGQMQNNWKAIQTGDVSFIPQVVNFDDRSVVHVPDIPVNPDAEQDTIRLYSKQDGSFFQQLYAKDENSEIIQLTRFGNQLPFVWAAAIISSPSTLSTNSGAPTALTITNGLASAYVNTSGSDSNIIFVNFDTTRQPPNTNYIVIASGVSSTDNGQDNNRFVNMFFGSASTTKFGLRMQNRASDTNRLDCPIHVQVVGLFTL